MVLSETTTAYTFLKIQKCGDLDKLVQLLRDWSIQIPHNLVNNAINWWTTNLNWCRISAINSMNLICFFSQIPFKCVGITTLQYKNQASSFSQHSVYDWLGASEGKNTNIDHQTKKPSSPSSSSHSQRAGPKKAGFRAMPASLRRLEAWLILMEGWRSWHLPSPETNGLPLNIGHPERKFHLNDNHWFCPRAGCWFRGRVVTGSWNQVGDMEKRKG